MNIPNEVLISVIGLATAGFAWQGKVIISLVGKVLTSQRATNDAVISKDPNRSPGGSRGMTIAEEVRVMYQLVGTNEETVSGLTRQVADHESRISAIEHEHAHAPK